MARLFTRRNFLLGGSAALGAAAGGAGYMRWFEPGWLEVTRTRIPLPSRAAGPRPLRVLHLSDLHAHRAWVPLTAIAQAVAAGVALRPDAICLTGDFVTARYDDFPDYIRVLQPLTRAAPTFACLGNHDGGGWSRDSARGYAQTTAVQEFLAAAGVRLLHNTAAEISVAGRRVQFIGVGDWWARETKPERAFAEAAPRGEAVRLLLNHNPDAKIVLRAHDWDVMLSGHTHGGQIGLPWVAARIAPVQDKRFIAGLYMWEGRHIFITRGVGNLHGVRLFCRPEVSLLEIG
jgi:predicted MPP superfamily phosphohydrolase